MTIYAYTGFICFSFKSIYQGILTLFQDENQGDKVLESVLEDSI